MLQVGCSQRSVRAESLQLLLLLQLQLVLLRLSPKVNIHHLKSFDFARSRLIFLSSVKLTN